MPTAKGGINYNHNHDTINNHDTVYDTAYNYNCNTIYDSESIDENNNSDTTEKIQIQLPNNSSDSQPKKKEQLILSFKCL
ncbi:14325_t:CDS:2 [Dentiscutata heterogama]|uniref:14325_t:CDS:1 n=1 Tax=Dentiscutata heterogama TaxID=1316150 RepID=A0ACA9JZF5_9GLOM|nr:14325_t:CDS:2 [Dentiscutata heterogama]